MSLELAIVEQRPEVADDELALDEGDCNAQTQRVNSQNAHEVAS